LLGVKDRVFLIDSRKLHPILELFTISDSPPRKSQNGSGLPRKALMACESCGSENQTELGAEINLHFRRLQNLDKPSVLVFPKLLVCLDCGFSRFTLPEAELRLLRDGAESTASVK
jgi:hypothetical protein